MTCLTATLSSAESLQRPRPLSGSSDPPLRAEGSAGPSPAGVSPPTHGSRGTMPPGGAGRPGRQGSLTPCLHLSPRSLVLPPGELRATFTPKPNTTSCKYHPCPVPRVLALRAPRCSGHGQTAPTPNTKPGDPSLFSGPHWGSCILRSRAGGPRSWKTSSRRVSAGWGPGPSGSGEAAVGTGEGRLVLMVPGRPPVFLAPKEACSAPGPTPRCRPPRAVSAAAIAAQVTGGQAEVLHPGRWASGPVLPAGVGAEAPAPAASPTPRPPGLWWWPRAQGFLNSWPPAWPQGGTDLCPRQFSVTLPAQHQEQSPLRCPCVDRPLPPCPSL